MSNQQESARGNQLPNAPSQHSNISQRSTARVAPYLSSQENYLMFCKVQNTKQITALLSSICTSKDQVCPMEMKSTGIKIVAEEDKSFQAIARLKKEVFYEYKYSTDTIIKIDVQISNLIDCLNIFGSNPSGHTICNIAYPGIDSTISVMITEADVVTDARIKTRDFTGYLDYKFKQAGIITKIMMKSDLLKDLISEVDWHSDYVTLFVNEEHLVFQTTSTYGDLEVVLPSNCEAVQKFENSQQQTFQYNLKHLLKCLKALSQTELALIRVNSEGVFSLRVEFKPEPEVYAEYLILPTTSIVEKDSDDDDDDDDDDDGPSALL